MMSIMKVVLAGRRLSVLPGRALNFEIRKGRKVFLHENKSIYALKSTICRIKKRDVMEAGGCLEDDGIARNEGIIYAQG